ncbi:hypothetical protein ACFLXE_01725 [Chloroflexota bacterium]
MKRFFRRLVSRFRGGSEQRRQMKERINQRRQELTERMAGHK